MTLGRVGQGVLPVLAVELQGGLGDVQADMDGNGFSGRVFMIMFELNLAHTSAPCLRRLQQRFE
jgi:hypothetical protein